MTVSFKASLYELFTATFTRRILSVKHALLLLSTADSSFCFERTDWKKQASKQTINNQSLYIWQKVFQVTSKQPLPACPISVSACVMSGQQYMTGNLKMLDTCLPCDSCLPVFCPRPSNTCVSTSTHPSISSFLFARKQL